MPRHERPTSEDTERPTGDRYGAVSDHPFEEIQIALHPKEFIRPTVRQQRFGQHGRARVLVVVQFHHLLHKLNIRGEVVKIEKRSWIEVPLNKRIAPIEWHTAGFVGVGQLLRCIARKGAILKTKVEPVCAQKRLFCFLAKRNWSTNVVEHSASAVNSTVGAEQAEHLKPPTRASRIAIAR